jgi:predicted phage terminase large subunit-like protein
MTQTKPMENDDLLKQLHTDRAARTAITRKNHYWFFNFFFPHYVEYEPAKFQREIFAITEDESIKLAVIVAFRGSAKSTIVTMSYALWSILGIQQKKFVLILSKTQSQAKTHFTNLKRELESNELLRADLGPFKEESDEWGSFTIVIPKYNARITAASSEQSIRGIRHGEFRPQLILADDVEDLQSVKTLEGRDKAHQWFTGEVIPAGDKKTRIIVIGNLLHEDSLLKRLSTGIENNLLNGVYRFYPLLGENDVIAWPGKYPDLAAVESERKRVGNESSWQREYLLRIIPDLERVVQESWIHYYETLPDEDSDTFRYTATGIDLAISESTTADFTAMVSGKIFGTGKNLCIYILPNPVNERLDFPTTLERAKLLSTTLGHGTRTRLFIESVGYQQALIQQLKTENYPAEEFQTHGQDKRARVAVTTSLIQNGRIIFPKQGAERLIQQLVGFGSERHDDLADAFAILVIKTIEERDASFTIPSSFYDAKNAQPKTQAELDHEADMELIRKSHYERSGYNRDMLQW